MLTDLCILFQNFLLLLENFLWLFSGISILLFWSLQWLVSGLIYNLVTHSLQLGLCLLFRVVEYVT